MKPIVFLGPTLPVELAKGVLDAIYLSPVAQGDVCRAVQLGPPAIGIVDGLFDQVPAVWHKEILWAISRGVPVYGAASMGALRASELHPFGMTGVGRIFEDYRDGRLEDDDEVALAHGPAAWRYVGLSEPMVNVRATLEAARAKGHVSSETATALVRLAKSVFYPDREWPLILDAARKAGLPGGEVEALQAFLVDGRVDQKRLDALEMLGMMAAEADRAPAPVSFRFNATALWREACATAGELVEDDEGRIHTVLDSDILDELRLEQSTWLRLKDRVHPDLMEGIEQGALDEDALEIDVVEALEALRIRRGLGAPEAMKAWMASEGLDEATLYRRLYREVRQSRLEERVQPSLLRAVLAQARRDGVHGRLARRAVDKRRRLSAKALDGDGGVDGDAELIAWYSAGAAEGAADVRDLARELAFASETAFLRTLRRERHYQALGGHPPA